MPIYYNDTTKGFYDSAVNRVVPDGSIEISTTEHNQLLHAQGMGKTISVVNGTVMAIDTVIIKTWEDIRKERSIKLAACDWTQLLDTAMTDPKRQEWAVYRQALRDITERYATPDEVVWPRIPD
jgi:hypothetical protein